LLSEVLHDPFREELERPLFHRWYRIARSLRGLAATTDLFA
jgi:hypothetical protein